MSQPILDLSNSSNFVEVYETILTAGSSPVPNYHAPIPLHQIPVVFDCHTILVGASSSTAKPNWRLGFYLRMLVTASVGTAEASNNPIPFGLNLIRLPKLSNEYRLKAYIPKWHQTMEMKLWKYIGPESGELDLLEQIKIKTDTL